MSRETTELDNKLLATIRDKQIMISLIRLKMLKLKNHLSQVSPCKSSIIMKGKTAIKKKSPKEVGSRENLLITITYINN